MVPLIRGRLSRHARLLDRPGGGRFGGVGVGWCSGSSGVCAPVRFVVLGVGRIRTSHSSGKGAGLVGEEGPWSRPPARELVRWSCGFGRLEEVEAESDGCRSPFFSVRECTTTVRRRFVVAFRPTACELPPYGGYPGASAGIGGGLGGKAPGGNSDAGWPCRSSSTACRKSSAKIWAASRRAYQASRVAVWKRGAGPRFVCFGRS